MYKTILSASLNGYWEVILVTINGINLELTCTFIVE